MTALVMMLILILVFLTAEYSLYRFVFMHPKKKRPDAHHIPESTLYNAYRESMAEVVEDMEKTAFENVSIRSREGLRLCGRLYIIKRDAPLMIFFHGYHGVYAWDGYGCFKICKNNGINILMVDERAHGESESNVITFGIRERYDCKLWTDYALERFGKNTDIILAGVSMGAASVLMASELGLPENVKVIVADCGYSEPAAIIKEILKRANLPVKPLYRLINLSACIFGHFNLEEAAPLKAVEKLQIPTLFIHGEQDTVVPVSMNKELYKRCAGKKECILIEKADHANSAMTDFEAYETAVMGFLGKWVSC